MSELIGNAKARKGVLKHLILQLHEGKTPEEVKPQLMRLLGRVPYSEVVEVEQELISEGMPTEKILDLCDLHSAAMKGALDSSSAKSYPVGHPVDTFKRENEALMGELALVDKLFDEVTQLSDTADASDQLGQMRVRFNQLSDVDKHYSRKENLLFPYLEKKGVTGPPTVMWGKDDEVRELLKGAFEALAHADKATSEEAQGLIDLVFRPVTDAIKEMIFKEEEILFPMSLDKLDETEWYAINRQSPEIGFCLYDPADEWRPEGGVVQEQQAVDQDKVSFSSGALTPTELGAILNTIPFDLTFVGADDKVKYFTQGRERIFARNRAILGRNVKMCHPPGSVHIVQKILEDFKSGHQSQAPFWITMNDRFIHIEYYAIRDEDGKYLGTLEVSQDLTEKRALSGQQRLLSYEEK